jgi:hypothetical protein
MEFYGRQWIINDLPWDNLPAIATPPQKPDAAKSSTRQQKRPGFSGPSFWLLN